MYCSLLIFCTFCIITSGDHSSLYMNEIRSLSELPMDKLIHIRSSLANNNGKSKFFIKQFIRTINKKLSKHYLKTRCDLIILICCFILPLDVTSENENKDVDISSRTLPLTLPTALKRNGKKPIRRYGDDDKDKETKISKIFQLAVTALSFLAFGGYLLTLIITAIRRNSTDSTGNVVIFSVTIVTKCFLCV